MHQSHPQFSAEFRLHPRGHQLFEQSSLVPAPPAAIPNQFDFFLRRNDSASSLAGAVGSADEVVTYAYRSGSPDCCSFRTILEQFSVKIAARNSGSLATLSVRPRFTGDGGVDREELHHHHNHNQQQLVPRNLVAPDFLAGYSNRRLDHRRRHRHGHSRQSVVAPPPNSQSSSPVTTGSSPEAAVAASHTQLTTSPASPRPPIGEEEEEDEFEIEPLRPLSILRSSSSASWGVDTLPKFIVHPDLYQLLGHAHDKRNHINPTLSFIQFDVWIKSCR